MVDMTPDDLKVARLKLNLTQAELGNQIEMTREMVGLMERGGKRIQKKTAMAVKFLLLKTLDNDN